MHPLVQSTRPFLRLAPLVPRTGLIHAAATLQSLQAQLPSWAANEPCTLAVPELNSQQNALAPGPAVAPGPAPLAAPAPTLSIANRLPTSKENRTTLSPPVVSG